VRITRKDLEAKEMRVNLLLHRISLRVGGRYGYTAIDIYRNGKLVDTLVAGLTKKQAYTVLDCIERVLREER